MTADCADFRRLGSAKFLFVTRARLLWGARQERILAKSRPQAANSATWATRAFSLASGDEGGCKRVETRSNENGTKEKLSLGVAPYRPSNGRPNQNPKQVNRPEVNALPGMRQRTDL